MLVNNVDEEKIKMKRSALKVRHAIDIRFGHRKAAALYYWRVTYTIKLNGRVARTVALLAQGSYFNGLVT